MKKGLLTFGILTALAIFDAQAQEPKETVGEKWRCYGLWDFNNEKVLVTLTRLQKNGVDTGNGDISTADGINYRAKFQIAGFERRWNFGNGERMKYAFIILQDGDGAYYDFSQLKPEEKTGPKILYSCVKQSKVNRS